MSPRLIVIAVLLAAIGGALWLVGDEGRMEALRAEFGLAPAFETDVETLEPTAIDAELTRLAALPIPGVEAREGEAPPPLGPLAEAGVRCAVETAAVTREPKRRAQEGLRRYLLVLGAAGAAPDSPLLEPRLRELRPLLARGPRALRQAAAEGKLTPRERAMLAEFHETYARIEHPLYRGLELYDRTFQALDFQSLVQRMAERRDEIADCAVARVLPAPEPASEAESAGGAAEPALQPEGAVAWLCEGHPAALRTEVLATEPPTLRLERDGAADTGVAVPAAAAARYEGDGWAFSTTGEAALLEAADGAVAACVRAESGG